MSGSVALRVVKSSGDGEKASWPLPVRLWARTVGVRGWRRLALAVVLGATASLAMPPLHLVPVLVPAFCGLLWLVHAERRITTLAAVGFAFGMGYFTAGLYWVANALLTKPEQFGLVAPLAPVGLAMILAPFFVLPVIACRLSLAGSIARVVVFAAAWTVAEWLRAWVFTGFPWNLIGTTWTFAPAMIQAAAVFGVFGLSLVTVLAAAMPSILVQSSNRRRALAAVVASFGALALVVGGGSLRLWLAAESGSVDGVWLRLVQPNIAQDTKWRRDLVDRHLVDQVELGDLPLTPRPTHVIWSEVAAPLFLTEDEDRLRLIADHTPEGGLTIVGTLRRTPPDQPFQIWNSLVAIDSRGQVVASYDKSHLVPFGEYMPLRNLLGIRNVTIGFADFSAGPGVTTLALPGLPPVSPLICYEVIFPGAVADPHERPQWLLNLTNDGWYGISAGPYQHLAAARLRAVEEGLPVVRVANTGISAIIDGYGRDVRRLGLGVRGVVDGPLPEALDSPPLFARLGNTPVVAVSVILVVVIGWMTRRR